MDISHSQLQERFIALGLTTGDAAQFARQELTDDKPILSTLLLACLAARQIRRADDLRWIDNVLASRTEAETDKTNNLQPALLLRTRMERLLERGVTRQEIQDFTRAIVQESLYAFASSLDLVDTPTGFEDVHWCMFETDAEGNPSRRIEAVEEFFEPAMKLLYR